MNIGNAELTAIIGVGTIAVTLANYWISVGMDRNAKKTLEEKQADDKKALENEDKKLRDLIDKLFTWKDQHLKDSTETRLLLSNQLSKLFTRVEVNDNKYSEILKRLDELKAEFSEFRKNQA